MAAGGAGSTRHLTLIAGWSVLVWNALLYVGLWYFALRQTLN